MGQTIKCTSCIRRRPDLTIDEFERYWLQDHSALILKVAGVMKMRRYVQSHLLRWEMTDIFSASRNGIEPFDGLAEVWFDADDLEGDVSREQLEANIALIEDERNFIDLERSSWFFTVEHVFIDGPVD
jgi:hypothetical protein